MRGLYQRYFVKRVDGKEDLPDQHYFVLKFKKGKLHDLAALRAYCDSLDSQGIYPELSSDLRQKLEELV